MAGGGATRRVPVVRLSQVRHQLVCAKTLTSDTGWRTDAIPPRFSVFATARPVAAGWEWRCLSVVSEAGAQYRLLFEISQGRGKWKCALIEASPKGDPRAVARFEDQPGLRGGGLHAHANCEKTADFSGADSLEMAYTLPDHGKLRRRRTAWTKERFVFEAGRFFRVQGLKLQEELPFDRPASS